MDTNYLNLFPKHMCTSWDINGYYSKDYLMNLSVVEDILLGLTLYW